MTTADEALSREVKRGMTRQDILRRAAALGIVVSGTTLGPMTEAALASTEIKRGGLFKQATSGGSSDFIDGQHIVAKSDIARLVATFEGLARFDEKGVIKLHLAEELKAEKANQYLIRVRDGIEFHNGKTLNIDDVIYSIKRTKNPKLKLFGNAAFGAIDLNGIKKLDKRTCRLKLSRPDVTLLEAFAQYFQGVVPKGYQPNAVGKGPLQYIGTGPFKVKSFTPGRLSVHVKNTNYWITGQPYFDQVQIINFDSDAAKVNALLSGQVHAMADVPFAQVPVVRGRSSLRIYTAQTGAWTPLCMRVDVAPYNDVRVRRAFRLLINRPQAVQQGLSGFGRVANDVYSPFDPAYAGDEFPQRKYDPDQARSLLKQAGQDNLSVELITSPQDTGMVEGATIFAANAKAAGVNVTVKNVDGGTIYGDQYLKWPFSADYWGTRNYLLQAARECSRRRPSTRRTGTRPRTTRSSRRCTGRRSERSTSKKRARDHQGDAEDGVRRRRPHHLGLQEPDRRVLREGRRLQDRPRNAEPQQVRQRLPHDLLRLGASGVPGRRRPGTPPPCRSDPRRARTSRRSRRSWRRPTPCYVPRIGRAPAPVDADYRSLVEAGEVWVCVSDGSRRRPRDPVRGATFSSSRTSRSTPSLRGAASAARSSASPRITRVDSGFTPSSCTPTRRWSRTSGSTRSSASSRRVDGSRTATDVSSSERAWTSACLPVSLASRNEPATRPQRLHHPPTAPRPGDAVDHVGDHLRRHSGATRRCRAVDSRPQRDARVAHGAPASARARQAGPDPVLGLDQRHLHGRPRDLAREQPPSVGHHRGAARLHALPHADRGRHQRPASASRSARSAPGSATAGSTRPPP